MKNYYKSFTFLSLLILGTSAFPVHAMETKAKNALLMDFDTGTILLEKNADEKMPPASMSKLMTAYMIFERLENNSLSLDDKFTVSENAWKKGGAKTGSSTMFLNIGDKVKLSDLLRGIIIQSGNDACITAAENIAGSEKEFVEQANEKAQELGLTNTHLVNATGWPHKDHYMSAKDLATLSALIIRQFPQYYSIYSEKEFTYNGIKQENRNPLLFLMPEFADGIKTGHTSVSGYGLVGSAKKGDRRLIMVINGLNSMKERSEEAEKLILWGFRDFDNYTIVQKDKDIVDIPVWFGEKNTVAAVAAQDVVLTLPKGKQKKVTADIRYETPLNAPVKKGEKIATLTLRIPDQEPKSIDLFSKNDVKRLGYFGRLKELIKYALFKNMEAEE